jgi:hypothetical protein
MYFDLTPKIRKKDLYDFEEEFMEFEKGIKVTLKFLSYKKDVIGGL